MVPLYRHGGGTGPAVTLIAVRGSAPPGRRNHAQPPRPRRSSISADSREDARPRSTRGTTHGGRPGSVL
jgi:hypothetical protein